MRRRGFSLVELLVVIAVIALLIGTLLPALFQARRTARATRCLATIRQIELAHVLYMAANKDRFADAGLAHGGVTTLARLRRAWPVTLASYAGTGLAIRSPVDRSPAWAASDGGEFAGLSLPEVLDLLEQGVTPDLSRLARWSSYGLNNWLTSFSPGFDPREPFDTLAKIPDPTGTVHFLMMTQGLDGSGFARADHVHAETWGDGPAGSAPFVASAQADIAAHGGSPRSWAARSNFAFLDGHAATLPFSNVYTNYNRNRFWPNASR